MSRIKIVLNGNETLAHPKETILEVAKRNDLFIPTLCYDDRLEPYGACKVCLVKVEGAKALLPSCSTKVTDGMVIDTESDEVISARKLGLSLLISDHYGDCVSPCSIECPAHIDIQGYIALTAAGRYTEAVKLIKEKNPKTLTIMVGVAPTLVPENILKRGYVDICIRNESELIACDRSSALLLIDAQVLTDVKHMILITY